MLNFPMVGRNRIVDVARVACVPSLLAFAIVPDLLAQDDPIFRQLAVDETINGEDISRLDFDHDPEGEAIEVGSDVSTTYESYGCRISTSLQGFVPRTHEFHLNTGQSAANVSDDGTSFKGVTVFEFCLPSDPEINATVLRFGVSVGVISPRGTRLRLFDAEGGLIGQITTSNSGKEYLAFESTIPVASVHIIPVEHVDPDYAYDDVWFDTPVRR